MTATTTTTTPATPATSTTSTTPATPATPETSETPATPENTENTATPTTSTTTTINPTTEPTTTQSTSEKTSKSTTPEKTTTPIVGTPVGKYSIIVKKNYSSLQNRTHNYSFTSGLFYIENVNKTKVWGITNDNKIILENFEEGKAHQLWKKGEPDKDGYFILENSEVSKVITAGTSESGLEIKGKLTLR